MGTHRVVWRRTAVAALAAALAGQAALGAAAEDCAAIDDAGARQACAGRLAGASPQPSAAADGTVQSTIILLDRRPGGQLLFRLANGQVWEQQDVRFMAVEAGERVVIAPARLGGGHILATERSATARVRRIEPQLE